jgi:hypothetical protein
MIAIPVYRLPFASNKAKGRSAASMVGHALVDDADAVLADEYWTISPDGYAKTYRRGTLVFMHHAVAGKPDGLDISHLNANKLDNRRANLVVATRSQNMLNPADGPTRRNQSCGYRGVTRDDRSRQLAKPWRGKVQIDGRTYQTPRFTTPEDAAHALEALRESLGVRVRQYPEVGR